MIGPVSALEVEGLAEMQSWGSGVPAPAVGCGFGARWRPPRGDVAWQRWAVVGWVMRTRQVLGIAGEAVRKGQIGLRGSVSARSPRSLSTVQSLVQRDAPYFQTILNSWYLSRPPNIAGDAGYDLEAAVDVVLGPGERALVPTGIAVAIPAGYAGLVVPRSGLGDQARALGGQRARESSTPDIAASSRRS